MKLFPDFADLSGWKAESFFKWAFSIVLTKCIFVALMRIFNADASKVSFLENSIFNVVTCVVSTNAFEVVTDMLSYTEHPVLVEDKPISSTFIKGLFISKESILSNGCNYRHIPRHLLFILKG